MHSLFGTKHIIIMIISFLMIVVGFLGSKKLPLKTNIKILFYIGILSEVTKVFYYIVANEDKLNGYLPKTDLPFHLCSIQIIFIAILYFSKNENIKRKLESFMIPSCLFGGIFAILIATDSSRNGSWIISLQYFGYHVAIAIFALNLLTNKEIKWNIKDYFNCLMLLALFGFGSIYLNSILYDGTSPINFMYTVGPPQEGLPYLNKNQGWLVYIIKYAFLAFVLISLLYIKPIIVAIKSKLNKNN